MNTDSNIILAEAENQSEVSSQSGLNTSLKSEICLNNKKRRIPIQSFYDSFFLKKVIVNDSGEKVLKFISEQVDLSDTNTILLSLKRKFFYGNNPSYQLRSVINLIPINQRKNINSYFKSINSLLPDAGMYIGCYEDYSARKKRIFKSYPRLFHKPIFLFDFIIHRVIPKLSLTKRLYSYLSHNENNAISKAETLGRLCYAGFEIITDEKIDGLSYFSVIKVREPGPDPNVSYGPLFIMRRISKGGKEIGVYKIRTMHPYSEYLQDYVVKMNGYNKVGKPHKDFRVTGWSRIIRKCYLDELPQIINILKGEMNIFGVRPLSKFGFNSLPADLQKERIKYKAGCIPPNVSLGLKGFYGVIWAERLYLRKMKKNSLLTNFKFFWMAVYNIIMRKCTSA